MNAIKTKAIKRSNTKNEQSPCSGAPLKVKLPPAKEMDSTVELLRALAHPIRFKIFQILKSSKKGVCVCEFSQFFEIKQPTISHHLKILREAGLIEGEQQGLWVLYTLDPKASKNLKTTIGSI